MDIIDRIQRLMHAESAAVSPRTTETIEAMREAQAEIERLRGENERLGEIVRQRTFLLDQQMGTPCEQIRHEQEVERLRGEIERLARLLQP